MAVSTLFQNGIKKEGSQVSHESAQQETLGPVKIAPTSHCREPYSRVEDYELKVSITSKARRSAKHLDIKLLSGVICCCGQISLY
jgi:hypothetical protein